MIPITIRAYEDDKGVLVVPRYSKKYVKNVDNKLELTDIGTHLITLASLIQTVTTVFNSQIMSLGSAFDMRPQWNRMVTFVFFQIPSDEAGLNFFNNSFAYEVLSEGELAKCIIPIGPIENKPKKKR